MDNPMSTGPHNNQNDTYILIKLKFKDSSAVRLAPGGAAVVLLKKIDDGKFSAFRLLPFCLTKKGKSVGA